MKKRAYAFALMASVLLWNGVGLAAEKFGSAEDAKAMLDRAIAALKDDKTAALKAFNDEKNKQFRDRDLYVYCFGLTDGKFTAYEAPFLLGANIREMKLYNEPMGQRAFDVVKDAPEGTVVSLQYKLPKPGTDAPAPKEALEARVGDQACGVAYYK